MNDGDPPAEIGFGAVAPVFPVHDLALASRFYARLGFRIREYDTGYGFAERERLCIHLRASPELDEESSYAEVYVDTGDVDRLHAEWRALDLLPVRTIITADLKAEVRRRRWAGDPVGLISERVTDKPWGVREFSIRDPDNNQLRFGRPSSGGAPEEKASS